MFLSKGIVMDVQKLIFPDSHFDVIVDKGIKTKSKIRFFFFYLKCVYSTVGTMDALLCQEGACAIVNRMLVEIDRVLKPGGTYILITMGRTARRIPCTIQLERKINVSKVFLRFFSFSSLFFVLSFETIALYLV